MHRRHPISIAVVGTALAAALLAGACARRLPGDSGSTAAGALGPRPDAGPVAQATAPPPAEPVRAAPRQAIPERPAAPPPAPVPSAPDSPLKDVFFDTDRAVIRPDAAQALRRNAAWLQANPRATLLVEGHCDERGTAEYNLALGERRAAAVRDFLVAAGIPKDRVETVSYGNERPFILGHDEEAWRWNRRVHFVLRTP